MNLSRYFEHWRITENPFRGEEARHDPVFLRLSEMSRRTTPPPPIPPVPAPTRFPLAPGDENDSAGVEPQVAPAAAARIERGGTPHATHSDFEKIAGDFGRPSTSIVFGEKGSGKTAIRIQLANRAAEHNLTHPESRCLLVEYDDLNPVLDRFVHAVAGEGRKVDVAGALEKFRLVDHIDAILLRIVPRLVDAVMRPKGTQPDAVLAEDSRKRMRQADRELRRDLLLLQAVYDRVDVAGDRTSRLRRTLRMPLPPSVNFWRGAAALGWIVPAGAIAAWGALGEWDTSNLWAAIVGVASLVWLVALAKRLAWDRLLNLRLARRIRRELRVSARGDRSYARSLAQLDPGWRNGAMLPASPSDEQRYAMLERFVRIVRPLGCSGVVVVVDRVDEPTLIKGDPDRMRAVTWPLLNNKFLQIDGVGFKLLLPIELRHALFRESAAFFQQARLDKQNLIERLSWTGAMLYDLCNARLQACRDPDAEPISLLDLFAGEVTRQDIVDGLDQMHQPRDAFKMLYQCMVEHCSNVTEEQEQWRIPRLVLDSVRRQQSERVRQLALGVRPA